jgi:AP-3 complex subunit beta
MAGIRLHVVAPLVLVAVKKCARDPSPYVRKCAAYALCKLYDLLPEENTTLEEVCFAQPVSLVFRIDALLE